MSTTEGFCEKHGKMISDWCPGCELGLKGTGKHDSKAENRSDWGLST